MWTDPEPPPTIDTYFLGDRTAFADSDRGDHIGLEGIAAMR
jgi:hypothetical protein